jgi:hypothetical protein
VEDNSKAFGRDVVRTRSVCQIVTLPDWKNMAYARSAAPHLSLLESATNGRAIIGCFPAIVKSAEARSARSPVHTHPHDPPEEKLHFLQLQARI